MRIPSYTAGIIQVKAYRILQAKTSLCLKDHNLNPGLWLMLGVVAEARDGIRLAGVASALHVKAPLVTVMADELMKLHLINRIPHHQDNRAKLLVLTPKGRQFVKIVEADLTVMLSKLLGNISDAQMKAYREVLEAIIENSKAVD